MRHNSNILMTIAKQRGLSLVEIMIAITISVVLLAGVEKVFVSSKHTYRVQDALSRVQESGRFATDFLTKDIRMAGYTGCYRGNLGNIETLLNDPSAFNWDKDNMLAGNDWTGGGWTPALDAIVAGLVKDGTDVLVIRGLSNDGVNLTPPYSNSAQDFTTLNGDSIALGDILMATDCLNAVVFQVTNKQVAGGKVNVVHSNAGGYVPGNANPTYSTQLKAGASLARFVTRVYYIGTNVNGNPALFRKRMGSGGAMVDEELAEGIEDMQIEYGEDTAGDGIANRYVSANNAVMANVVSIRVGLLVETVEDNIATQPQDYSFMDTTTTPNDNRLRRAFYSVTKLRNRGIF